MWKLMIKINDTDWYGVVGMPATQTLMEAKQQYDFAVRSQPNREFKLKWVR